MKTTATAAFQACSYNASPRWKCLTRAMYWRRWLKVMGAKAS
jgi:hypothetical protein